MLFDVAKKLRNFATSLLGLALLAIPFVVSGVVWWLCASLIQLSEPFPMIASAATLVAFIVAFYFWMIFLQKKEDKIVGSLEHPFFGLVQQKATSWEASISIANIGSNLLVSSYEGNQPTPNQQETVGWIERSAELIKIELEDCLDGFSRDVKCDFPDRPRDLIFDTILLDSDNQNTFSIGFDVVGANLPWGFTALYTNGQLDEFTDDH